MWPLFYHKMTAHLCVLFYTRSIFLCTGISLHCIIPRYISVSLCPTNVIVLDVIKTAPLRTMRHYLILPQPALFETGVITLSRNGLVTLIGNQTTQKYPAGWIKRGPNQTKLLERKILYRCSVKGH